MDDKICPACKAANDDEARYCDQCGQPLEPAAAKPAEDGGCPACGGVVESDGSGKGVCASCGLELVETPEEAPTAIAPLGEGTVERLTTSIRRKVHFGATIDRAVTESCREIFAASEPTDVKSPSDAWACPLCGADGSDGAARCAGCGILFDNIATSAPCSRCERAVGPGGKCECGAILTLAKLLEFVEPSVRWICLRCKQPYAAAQPKCPDCGGSFVSADRLKAFAASGAED